VEAITQLSKLADKYRDRGRVDACGKMPGQRIPGSAHPRRESNAGGGNGGCLVEKVTAVHREQFSKPNP